MNEILVNVGPLTSLNSYVYYLAPKFQMIRDSYIKGETPRILFDLSSLGYNKGISIAALTALLSSSKKLRDFIGFPIPAMMSWDPELQGFLWDIGFFEISDRFKIFEWLPKNIVGGYTKRATKTNPNTKILYYADILKLVGEESVEEIGILKASLKQKIAPNFLMRCSNLFLGFDDDLEEIVGNTTLELIVNSLVHAEDIAFVGIQRTSKRISISVCDSGIGFPKSLKKTYKNKHLYSSLSNEDAILIGCVVQRNVHGLRLAISEVLNCNNSLAYTDNDGWVVISSFDTEIRWQKLNWKKALTYFDNIKNEEHPKIENAIGKPTEEYLEKNKLLEGYWKKNDYYMIGTRISFEIVL